MAIFQACLLKPKSPLHLGEREGMREGSETIIHSDTLFSAICNSLCLLYGSQQLAEFFARFNSDSPPLRLSSGFIFIEQENQRRYYFPTPRNQIPRDKEQKKIQFIEKAEWEKLLNGKRLDEQSKNFKLPESIIIYEEVPMVNISRLTGKVQTEGGFFHTGLFWLKDGGFFFLYNVADEWQSKFITAVRLMCDEGIGGCRSVGKGCFYQPEFLAIEIKTPDIYDAELMLSLYYPDNREINNLNMGFYELLERKGYIFSPAIRSYRRKTVSLFAEGSVFPGKSRKGVLIDVTPEVSGISHQIYRNGIAFAIPFILNPKKEEL